MKSARRSALLAVLWAALASGLAGPGAASPAGAAEPRASAAGAAGASRHAKAQARFAKARDHYKAGRYRAAIDELEAAIELDPEGAELEYNLALVHEKLGEIEQAIRHYKRYRAMVTEEEERKRADAIVQRLEGARKEVVTAPAAESSSKPAGSAEPPGEPHAGSGSGRKGKMDGWVVGTGVAGGVALLIGTIYGAKAMSDRVGDSPSTRDGTSYDDIKAKADRARSEALVADIGFGLAIGCGVAAALLYFTRSEEPSGPTNARRSVPPPSFALLPGGVAAGWGGSF
jgi:tetratricopeptide (TPR) repeat protein